MSPPADAHPAPSGPSGFRHPARRTVCEYPDRPRSASWPSSASPPLSQPGSSARPPRLLEAGRLPRRPGPPSARARGIDLERRRSRPAAGDGPTQAHLGPADLLLPAPDRQAQPRAALRDLTNPDALRIAPASDKQRRHRARSPAGGHPDPAQGQRRHRGPGADHGRVVRAREPTPAGTRSWCAAARGRRGAARQGEPVASGRTSARRTRSSGWSGVGGQTHNPYVLDRNPCGSSSGSAVGGRRRPRARWRSAPRPRLDRLSVRRERRRRIKPTLGLVSRPGMVPIARRAGHRRPDGAHVVDAALMLSVLPASTRPTRRPPRPRRSTWTTGPVQLGRPARRAIGVCARSRRDYRGRAIAVPRWRSAGAATPSARRHRRPGRDCLGGPSAAEFDGAAARVQARDRRVPGAPRRGAPGTLAGLIAFNNAHAAEELQFFGQEIFEAVAGDQRRPDRPDVPAAAGDR